MDGESTSTPINSALPAELYEAIERYLPELVSIRRDIHAHPELGMEEHRTAGLICSALDRWDVPFRPNIGKTGIVASISGRHRGERAIGLRADMDALAIEEATGLPYASVYPGRMHACGHDGHIAALLGAARCLVERPDFCGTVHLIFQPAEEGLGGAEAMISDGLFERFHCDAVYGLHTMPGFKEGTFHIRPGAFFAAACPWHVTFRGPGGHGGAYPHKSSDLSLALSHFIQSANTIVSRNLSANDSAVLSVGYVVGGTKSSPSVMPNEIRVGGTARCFSDAVGQTIRSRLVSLAHSCAAAFDCTVEIDMNWRTPPLINHPTQTAVAASAARRVSGSSGVDVDALPLTAGEDFARMLHVRPGAFALIGNGVETGNDSSGLHTSHFDFNDRILPSAIAYWTSLVQLELGHENSG